MLGKLIKYELKATSRWFLPIYVLALLLAPIERLSVSNMGHSFQLPAPWDKIVNTLFGFLTFAFVIVLIAIGVAAFVLIIYRFYKNLITNEGYLMHTLPVKTSELIWSKAIAAVIWSIASFVVIALAVSCLFVGTPGWNEFWELFPKELSYLLSQPGVKSYAVKFGLEFILMTLVGALCSIFMLYASIALGQLVTKHKILGAFGAYFVLNMGIQFLSTMIFIPLLLKVSKHQIDNLGVVPNLIVRELFPAYIVFMALLTAGFYFVTSYVFKKKLNLE